MTLQLMPRWQTSARQIQPSLTTMTRIAQALRVPVVMRFDEPPSELPITKYGGTELLHVLVGAVEVAFGSQRYELQAGDSLQFAGSVSHGITAVRHFPTEVLSVKGWGIVRDA